MRGVFLDVLEILLVLNEVEIDWNEKLVLVKCAEPFDPGHSNFLDWFYLLLLHLRIDTKTVVSLMFTKLRLLTFERQLLLLAVIQKYLVLIVFVFFPVFFLVHSHLL